MTTFIGTYTEILANLATLPKAKFGYHWAWCGANSFDYTDANLFPIIWHIWESKNAKIGL